MVTIPVPPLAETRPPPVPRVIFMLEFAVVLVRNWLPFPIFRFWIVPPFNVRTELAVGVNEKEVLRLKVAPLFMVRAAVVSVLIEVPACWTVPSLTRIEAAVWADVVVSTNVPVASVPAENTALDPVVQPVVGDAPRPPGSVFQKVLVPQLPVGVVPAPATVLVFASQ